MSSTDGAERYAVGYSAAHVERLREWGELAKSTGQGASYLAAVREMREEL